MNRLYAQLCRYASVDWSRAVDVITPTIRQIDRNATRIWFAFWPLDLHLALESASDPAAEARSLRLMGRWRLADQIDESIDFFSRTATGRRSRSSWPPIGNGRASSRRSSARSLTRRHVPRGPIQRCSWVSAQSRS